MWPILENGVDGEGKWAEPYELVWHEWPLTVEWHNNLIYWILYTKQYHSIECTCILYNILNMDKS